MTESEKDKQNANRENLDINNLQSNLLKQHWASVSNLWGAIYQHAGHHFPTYQAPFYSMLGAIS